MESEHLYGKIQVWRQNIIIKLSAREWDLIAVWLGGRIKIREIGRRLERSPGTISDEISGTVIKITIMSPSMHKR